jgi:hypothetical protein
MTNHEDKELSRLATVLASESGDSVAEILISLHGMEFRDAKATLQDDIITWQARNQYDDDYNNGYTL